MIELVMIGFGDRHRATDVLTQVQRLEFDWASDLRNAIAVEVENDGRLRMLQSLLVDPAADPEDAFEWRALLSAIVPLPYLSSSSPTKVGTQVRTINDEGSAWLENLSLDPDFARNASALLRPGNSAILATIHDWQSAIKLLSGYSHLVLHTTVQSKV
jgi:uncharacterized membrane protein